MIPSKAALRLMTALALPILLGACTTARAVQQDMSNVVGSMGLVNVGRMLSTRPAGGMNTYDPSTGGNLSGSY